MLFVLLCACSRPWLMTRQQAPPSYARVQGRHLGVPHGVSAQEQGDVPSTACTASRSPVSACAQGCKAQAQRGRSTPHWKGMWHMRKSLLVTRQKRMGRMRVHGA